MVLLSILGMVVGLAVGVTAYLLGLAWLGKKLGWDVHNPWFPLLALTALGLLAHAMLGPIE